MVLEHDKERLVVRFTNNNVIRVVCDNISQITIDNSSRCYDKIQVSYMINAIKQFGFLDQYGLISNKANKANCSDTVVYYAIPSSNTTLIKNGSKIMMTSDINIWNELPWSRKLEENKIVHSKWLLDVIKKHEDIEQDVEVEIKNVFMPHVQTIEIDKQESSIWIFIKSLLNNNIAQMVIVISIIIIIFSIYKGILALCKRCSSTKKDETIAMNVIIEQNKSTGDCKLEGEKENTINAILNSLPSKAINKVNQDEDLQKKSINLLREDLLSKQLIPVNQKNI